MNTTYLATSLNNMCPEGLGLGLMTRNGTSYLVCDSRFPEDTTTTSMYVGLGVSIGLGASVVLFAAYKQLSNYYQNKIYRKKSHLSDSSDESDA
jgi:hypothetical protein